MSKFYDTFYSKALSLFKKANELDKPIHPDMTWVCGLINGRDDYLDLQCHALVLMASIIINEPVVPRIICTWDTRTDYFTLKNLHGEIRYQYPTQIMAGFKEWNGFKANDIMSMYRFKSRYVEFNKSGYSVGSYPNSLGMGYRAKYNGLNTVKTKYSILSDIDTVCINPCLEKIFKVLEPNTFCWTNFENSVSINVGLCVFNMEKYFSYFFPALMRYWWELPYRDSEIIKFLKNKEPMLLEKLSIKTFGNSSFVGEKYHYSRKRKDILDNNTCIYHAWKGDTSKGHNDFYDYYSRIIDNLINEKE